MRRVAKKADVGNATGAPREQTAQRLRDEIARAPPPARAARLVERVQNYERSRGRTASLAREQLDMLEARIAYVRRALGERGEDYAEEALEVVAAANRLFTEAGDSPTAIAARLAVCAEHALALAAEAKCSDHPSEGAAALLSAAQQLGSFGRILRLEFAEHYPEHAEKLTLKSADALVESFVPGPGLSKWNVLEQVCREIGVVVKAEDAKRRVQKMRKNAE